MSACPLCSRPAGARAANAAFPFCDERCRVIDLGNWLGEVYRIPGEPPDGGDGVPPEDDEPDGTAPPRRCTT